MGAMIASVKYVLRPVRQAVVLALLLGATAGYAQPAPAPAPKADPDPWADAALQTALDREGFGPGLVDNRAGRRTRSALADFARARGMSVEAARTRLLTLRAPFCDSTVTDEDLALVGTAPRDWLEASQAPRMAYRSLLEALSEKFHGSEALLQKLNPSITAWDSVPAGTPLRVPNVRSEAWHPSAARIEIDCAAFRLRAFDTNGVIIASFPCSIAADPSRIPTGSLQAVTFAPHPNYTFDPANFPESPRAQEIGRKLIIPPGPNNPVGDHWIGLSQPGYGIHGTHSPETIGRPESHGCFRLTNWDIATLSSMLQAGTPLQVYAGAPPQ